MNAIPFRILPLVLALLVLFGMPPAGRGAELVMFELPGCPFCRVWDRQVGVVYPLSEEGRRAPLRRTDLRGGAPDGLRLAAPVTVAPTFVVADGGREIGRITGYSDDGMFWGLLSSLLTRLPTPPH